MGPWHGLWVERLKDLFTSNQWYEEKYTWVYMYTSAKSDIYVAPSSGLLILLCGIHPRYRFIIILYIIEVSDLHRYLYCIY